MPAPSSPRIESIEIPDRPTVSSEEERTRFALPRRTLIWGAGSAAVVLALAIGTTLLTRHGGEEARAPAEVPLIKAEDEPIKVSPESPGGMDVPNRDIMIYGHLQHDKPGRKPAVERLLPEPEKPLTPPEPAPPPEPKSAEAPPSDAAPAPGEPRPAEPPLPSVPVAPVPAASQPKAQAHPVPAAPQAPAAPHAVKPQQTAPKPPPAKADAKAEEKPRASAKSGAYHVQLFSGKSQDEAKGAWSKLKGRNGDLLAPLSPTVARADLGERGTFYRLRVGPIDSEAKARSLCTSLSGRGVPCIVVPPAG